MQRTKRPRKRNGFKFLQYLTDKLAIWAAIHIEDMPYFVVGLLDKRFNTTSLMKLTGDYRIPKRVWLKEIKSPAINQDGSYLWPVPHITIGQRAAAINATMHNDPSSVIRTYFGIRPFFLPLTKAWKVNALIRYVADDLEARNERERKIQVPLTERQKLAGYDRLNFGMFGVIDMIARRNGLKYPEVETMRDDTIFAIVRMDAMQAKVQRQEMVLAELERESKRKKR